MLRAEDCAHYVTIPFERSGDDITKSETFILCFLCGDRCILLNHLFCWLTLDFYQVSGNSDNGATGQNKVVVALFVGGVDEMARCPFEVSSAKPGVFVHTIHCFGFAGCGNGDNAEKFKTIGFAMGTTAYHFYIVTFCINVTCQRPDRIERFRPHILAATCKCCKSKG